MRKIIFALVIAVLVSGWASPVYADVSPIQVTGVVEQLGEHPVKIQAVPNDPYYNQQWYLKRIKADQAWDITRGRGLVVAIVDTGVDFNHPDLVGKIWVNPNEVLNNNKDDDGNGYIDDYYGFNFIGNNANVDDYHGHGTGVASIIAASTNNGRGIAGVNWNARIMILKTLNNAGGGDFDDVARAIRYAVDNGADIINMSFGSATSSAILSNAVNYAVSRGVPMVAAVGNDGGRSILYPAAYPNVISVSGVDKQDEHPEFANSGSNINLSAPATDILMAGLVGAPLGEYVQGSGTSFAAAQVTGAASLVLGRYPDIVPKVLQSILKTNSDVLPNDNPQYFGSGVLNIFKAIGSSPITTTQVSVTNGMLPADGVSAAQVTVTLYDGDGRIKNNQEILVRATGSNTIINGQLVPTVTGLSLGRTNSLGRVSFTVSSTTVGPKELTFVDGTAKTPLSGKANLTFASPSRPVYSMQWLRQSPYPSLTIGESTELWVEVKNTGTVAWVSDPGASWDGRGQIKLGTDQPTDRPSIFKHDSWISSNRINYMSPPVVKPGEEARFTFQILASQVGNFREYFRPVVEYVAWLNDLGIYWDIKVFSVNGEPNLVNLEAVDINSAHYRAALNSQSSSVTLRPGDTTQLSVTLTNIGESIWHGRGSGDDRFGEVRIGTAQLQDRTTPFSYLSWISPNRVINAGLDIVPGGRMTLVFTIKAPDTPGVYQENFQLVAEYITWFGPVFGWTITVI